MRSGVKTGKLMTRELMILVDNIKLFMCRFF